MVQDTATVTEMVHTEMGLEEDTLTANSMKMKMKILPLAMALDMEMNKTISDLIEDGYGSGSGNGHGFGVVSPFRGYGDGEYSCGGFDDAQGLGCGQGQHEGDRFFEGYSSRNRINLNDDA
jgi:hypothetical protein